MRKHAYKIALFLLLGAIINLLVAWAIDWHANTAAQATSMVRPDDARTRGWIGRLPGDAIATWGWERVGISYVAVVAFDDAETHELDVSNNLIRIQFESITTDMLPPVPEFAVVVETRVGWPMRAFTGRVETEPSPLLVAMGGSGRTHLAASLNMISRRAMMLDRYAKSGALDLSEGEVRPERLEISSIITSLHSATTQQERSEDAASAVRPERRPSDAANRRPSAGRTVVRDESAEIPANDDGIEVTGHFGIGIAELRPLPAAANSRWNLKSIAQNFDGDYRVWPLPYRPLWPGFAVNTVVYALLIWLFIASATSLRRAIRKSAGHCPRCKYDLRGGPHECCPECGKRIAGRRCPT